MNFKVFGDPNCSKDYEFDNVISKTFQNGMNIALGIMVSIYEGRLKYKGTHFLKPVRLLLY